MAERLEEWEIEELKSAFRVLDKDGDGFIGKNDLGTLLRSAGDNRTEDELEDLIKVGDDDQDGVINLQDFLNIMAITPEEQDTESEDGLTPAFELIYKDRNGFISEGEHYCGELAKWFTKKDIKECESLFRDLDKDGDGFINAEDLGTITKQLGENLTKAELEDMINDADADQNGVIDFNEFLNAMARSKKSMKRPESEQKYTAAFELFDEDQDGFISVAELRDAMAALGEELTDEEAHEMMGEADADGDGQLNYEEFVRMLVKTE